MSENPPTTLKEMGMCARCAHYKPIKPAALGWGECLKTHHLTTNSPGIFCGSFDKKRKKKSP